MQHDCFKNSLSKKIPGSSDTDPGWGRPCGLVRRLASMVYDGFIVLAIWMLGAGVVVALLGGHAVEPASALFQIYLWLLAWLYFAVCWTRGGKTLGMRAWNIHLRGLDGPVRLPSTLIRYTVAWISALALGLGFLWSLLRSDRATWHDLASHTRLVVHSGGPGTQKRRNNQ